jgi:hypothetical protein
MASNTVTTRVIADTSQFSRGIRQASSQLSGMNKIASQVGRTMQFAIAGGLLAAGYKAAEAAVQFDLASAKLRALSDGDTQGVKGLNAEARRLGETSIFTAAEVGNMQVSLKKLGITVKEIDGLSEPIVQFATAMDTDLAVAGEVAIKTVNRFRNEFSGYASKAEAAAEVTETFAYATLNSALQFDTLQNSLKYVGSEADAAGFSFSDTVAILAKLADAGFEGSKAGTVLRRILQSLAKDGVVDLKQGFDDLITTQQEFAQVVQAVGVRAVGGTLSIQGLKDEIADFSSKAKNSQGAIQGLFDEISESTYGKLKNLASAIQEVGILLLEKFEKPIKSLITKLADWARGIDEGDIRLAKMVATFLVVSKALSVLIGVMTSASTNFGLLGARLLSMGPAGAIVLAAVAGLAIISGSMDAQAAKARDLAEAYDEAAKAQMGLGQSAFDSALLKGFGSQREFVEAASARVRELRDSADGLKQEVLKNNSAKSFENITELLEKGYSVGQIVNAKKQQSDGKLLARDPAILERFKILANQAKAVLELNKEAQRVGKLMEDGIFNVDKYVNVPLVGAGGDGGDGETGGPTDQIKAFEDRHKAFLVGIDDTERYTRYLRILAKAKNNNAEATAREILTLGQVTDATKEEGKVLQDLTKYYQAKTVAANKSFDTADGVAKWAQLSGQYEEEQKAIVDAAKAEGERLKAESELAEGRIQRMKDAMSEMYGMAVAVGTALSQTISDWADGSKTFAQSVKDNILKALQAVLIKVLALIAAFIILNILSGGMFAEGGVGKTAQALLDARGTELGAFLGSGMGFDAFNKTVTVNGSLSGSDMVLTNQRGGNALNRTYG